MPIRGSPNGASHTRPQPGRDRSEQVVAINRNRWSQSIGTGGRDQSECAIQRMSSCPLPYVGFRTDYSGTIHGSLPPRGEHPRVTKTGPPQATQPSAARPTVRLTPCDPYDFWQFRTSTRVRARHGVLRLRQKLFCGARTRRGTACKCKALRTKRWRCRLHGGLSTGGRRQSRVVHGSRRLSGARRHRRLPNEVLRMVHVARRLRQNVQVHTSCNRIRR